MSEQTELPVLRPGSPCPRGCTIDVWQREPELLTANIDGELSCPTCWDYFGIIGQNQG